jgi:hypothetical protein
MFSRSAASAATINQELVASEAFADGYGGATRAYYGALPTMVAFDQVLERDAYLALPSDWLVCVTDVVASGKEVGAGRYKAVNLAGASAISAVSNELGGLEFPFSFGGDGARFVVHPSDARLVADTLSRTSRWVSDQLKLELRIGMIPVRAIRDAGNDVLVARHGESASAQFALFMGGGIEWAESELKHGRFSLSKGSTGDRPNLTGLSCQWGPMVSKNAQILSVIVKPFEGDGDEAFLEVVKGVLSSVERLGGQSPVPESGPKVRWSESGIDLAARLSSGRGPLWLRKFSVVGATFLYWIFFKFGMKLGRYDANKYRRAVAVNSDFRKYDDGLYLTLDCSSELAVAITTLLESASKSRAAKCGVFAQRRALLTCVVPSAADGKHVHFLDGEGGGYVAAAEKMKDQFCI